MKILVGLGNPGSRYETTRHNIGFLAIDSLVDRWKATGPQSSYQAEIFQASIDGEKILLVKPQTFMNNSGQTVGPLLKFFKASPDDLIVIHDDLDLKPEAIRIKTGGGTGGHNGLKSIDAHLGVGQTGYHRIRLGIGRPHHFPELGGISTVDFVLQQFSQGECDGLEGLFDTVEKACRLMIAGKVTEAMNRHNTRPEAQKES
jgi:PTH1 family peptidyl-tRNA hydrolase